MKPLALALLAISLFTSAAMLPAQTNPVAPAGASAAVPPPMLPMRLNYRYWPVQFVQFVGPELPYAMVMLEVVPGKHPLLQVTLTDRASGKRVHYTDSDMLIVSAAALGEEAHKVALAYEPADTDNPGSVSSVRFTMPDGKPLEWRFVQGSDISAQGSGLTPFPDSPVPIFAYREQGALAAEGTVLSVGGVVSTISVWKEMSHPPYFIAYHGAETLSAHTLVFLPGTETWIVKSSPATLAAGSTWELEDDFKHHRSLRIDKADGEKLTVTGTDSSQPGVHYTLDAMRDGDGWSIERVRFAPNGNGDKPGDGDKHTLTLEFARPLGQDTGAVAASLIAGRKTVLATAMVASAKPADGISTVTFNTPAWLAGKTMTEARSAGSSTITLSAHP